MCLANILIIKKEEYGNMYMILRLCITILQINCGGGEYNYEGLKTGKWTELSNHFRKNQEITYNGYYKEDQKTGIWNTLYNGKYIGGGLYNFSSNKCGIWIELIDQFNDKSQITYRGEYENGKKIGNWSAWWMNKQGKKKDEYIGGGSYHDLNSYKLGRWIELDEQFRDLQQIIYVGEYQNGGKVGGWDSFYRGPFENEFQQVVGGEYDEQRQIKIGRWIELSDGFWKFSQVIYEGDYLNGKKIGSWKIVYQGKYIGGGQYNQQDSTKIGKWIDVSYGYNDDSQVTFNGEYQNGKKIGRWQSLFKGKHIAGGLYDEISFTKNGKWVELNEGFSLDSLVTFNGQYKYGCKVGRWNILFEGKVIGGGSYDELNSVKNGEWVELSVQFWKYFQVIQRGLYEDGKKTGIWEELVRDDENIIEGFIKCKEIYFGL